MKKLYYLLLLFVGLFPFVVHADIQRSPYELEMYDLLSKERKLNITSISTLPLDYLGGGEWFYDLEYSAVIKSYIDNLDTIVNYRKKHTDRELITNVYCVSYDNCGIFFKDSKYDYSSDFDPDVEYEYALLDAVHFDINIKIEQQVNQNIYNYIGDKFDSFFQSYDIKQPDDFYLFDLAYINQFINLSEESSSFLDIGAGSRYAELAFPEIKYVYEEIPGLSLIYATQTARGDEINSLNFEEGVSSRNSYFLTYYNNVAYGINNLLFNISPVIFISSSTDNTSSARIETASLRIKEYIDDSSIKFTITDKNSNYTEAEHNLINNNIQEFLKGAVNKEVNVSGNNIYELQIGNKKTKLFIIPVDDEIITTNEVKSFEKNTGIRITTKSADVPLDSSLRVEVVTQKYSDKDIISAYDINLYSYYKNGFIKNTRSGTTVMIPVDDNFNERGKTIYYIDSNGKKENIDFELKNINNNKYITFRTNHFSVYAIAEINADESDDILSSPQTGDIPIILIGIICIVTIGYVLFHYKKNYI